MNKREKKCKEGINVIKKSKLATRSRLLTCVWKEPALNLCHVKASTGVSLDFSQSFLSNSEVLPLIRPRQFPSSFRNYYANDTMLPELLTASLIVNKYFRGSVIWQEFTGVSEHCSVHLVKVTLLRNVNNFIAAYGFAFQKMWNYVETGVKTSHLAEFKYINRIDIQTRKVKKEERYQEKKEYMDEIGRRGECSRF